MTIAQKVFGVLESADIMMSAGLVSSHEIMTVEFEKSDFETKSEEISELLMMLGGTTWTANWCGSKLLIMKRDSSLK